MNLSKNQTTIGFICTLCCFMVWGSLPLYWNLLFHLPVLTVLCYRIVWSWVFVVIAITFKKEWSNILKLISNKRILLLMLICGCFINLNWGLYIYAISSGHVVEASMGSYITPLISTFAGAIFFKEYISGIKKIAIMLALFGIIYMIVGYGKIPYIALSLAISFAIYGAVHKLIIVNVLDNMFYEMSLSLAPALIFLLFFNPGAGFFEQPLSMMAIIALAGPLTATPLMAFAAGVKRLQLTTVGIIQYVSPTITFFIGIFYFKEAINKGIIVVFAFIWIGVLLYLIDASYNRRLPPSSTSATR